MALSENYALIVWVDSILLTMFGIGDIIGAAMIIDQCTYADGLIPLMMNGLGVITIFSGVLIFYLLARDFEILYTNVYWYSFKVTISVLTMITYLIGLALVSVLGFVITDGVEDPGCTGARSYILFHIFFTAAVPFAPIVLVIMVAIVVLSLLLWYCIIITCLQILFNSDER